MGVVSSDVFEVQPGLAGTYKLPSKYRSPIRAPGGDGIL